jgi:hypothetical protein
MTCRYTASSAKMDIYEAAALTAGRTDLEKQAVQNSGHNNRIGHEN